MCLPDGNVTEVRVLVGNAWDRLCEIGRRLRVVGEWNSFGAHFGECRGLLDGDW